jgi:hypothetical protein
MITMTGKYLSVNEAADALSLTVGRIRQLLIANEIHGQKLNEKAWAIELREIKRYAKAAGKTLIFPAVSDS